MSVTSQADTEQADLRRERAELKVQPVHEHQELAAIYVKRGLSSELAAQVAQQLMAHDALGALAARTGGAPILRASLAMGLTAGVGKLFGTAI